MEDVFYITRCRIQQQISDWNHPLNTSPKICASVLSQKWKNLMISREKKFYLIFGAKRVSEKRLFIKIRCIKKIKDMFKFNVDDKYKL